MLIKMVLTFVFLLKINSAFAAISGLESNYTQALLSSQNQVINSGFGFNDKTCNQEILNLTDNNEIKIYVAFGYMDVSGQDYVDGASSFYQNGDVLDLDASAAFGKALTVNCLSKSTSAGTIKNKACGFTKSGNKYTKNIVDRFTGKNIRVVLQIGSASYSSNDSQNRSQYLDNQTSKSQNATAAFQNAFSSHDVVLYLGHARSGGGPDFNPPFYLSNGHVDYSYYKKNKPGVKNMISGLSAGQPKVVGLLACKSTGLFSGTLNQYAPNSIHITADALFDYNDILPTGLNIVEAVVSQRCNQNFTGVVKSYLQSNTLSVF